MQPKEVVTPVVGGVKVAIRVVPQSSRNGIGGIGTDADGKQFLKVRLTATPEDGKANAALIKFLAKEWKLHQAIITILSGHTARNKVLMVEGGSEELAKKIKESLSSSGNAKH